MAKTTIGPIIENGVEIGHMTRFTPKDLSGPESVRLDIWTVARYLWTGNLDDVNANTSKDDPNWELET